MNVFLFRTFQSRHLYQLIKDVKIEPSAVIEPMFSSMYIVYIHSDILQWLPLNGHEEALSQHHSICILSVVGICKQQSCSCLICTGCVVFQYRHLYQLLHSLLLKYHTNELLSAYCRMYYCNYYSPINESIIEYKAKTFGQNFLRIIATYVL